MVDYGTPMLNLNQVLSRLKQALEQRQPFSIVRFGHAEMYVINEATWPEASWDFSEYSTYCGITGPLPNMSRDIIEALLEADIAGLGDHTPSWQIVMNKIFQHYDLVIKRSCSAWISHQMVKSEEFFQLLQGKRIVLLGRRGAEGAAKFEQRGIKVVAALPLEGYEQINPTLASLGKLPAFDLVLAAAGVPATIICPRIAEKYRTCALDFGHALDIVIDGEEGFDFDFSFGRL
ncbi:GT-D fold domain-containing glycosyltransferase [Bacillota bacterium LX-D]|nr:GT-D fold domain-containing glycosyltransferase [Bacillota bacterium LX-D]